MSWLQAPACTPPRQDGLGSCHTPQLFYLLLHKQPGHIRARIYSLLIIASIYLLPTESRTVMFSPLEEDSCSLQSKWHWGEKLNAKSATVLNQEPMRKHNIPYCPCLALEKRELCSKKHQIGLKMKQCFLFAAWHSGFRSSWQSSLGAENSL